MISTFSDFLYKVVPRLRVLPWRLMGMKFKRSGVGLRIIGSKAIHGGENAAFGIHCWIECVTRYKGVNHQPQLNLGSNLSASDFLHISCADRIDIGDGCLFGSRVYIGDNSHGTMASYGSASVEDPAERPLADLRPIYIGRRCWVGDGAVILAGASVAAGSVVAANSVVKIQVDRPAVLGGVPARVLRYLDE